jgi:hypothetical protein
MGKKRVNVYIDGFNLYHSTLQHTHPDCRWLNLLELSKRNTLKTPDKPRNRRNQCRLLFFRSHHMDTGKGKKTPFIHTRSTNCRGS